MDLADDLGVTCAVVVVDADGGLLRAQRHPRLRIGALDEAADRAREALAAAGFTEAGAAAGLTLDGWPLPVGAVGVSGGPPGFAGEAVRSAVLASGLGRLHADA